MSRDQCSIALLGSVFYISDAFGWAAFYTFFEANFALRHFMVLPNRYYTISRDRQQVNTDDAEDMNGKEW